MGDKELLYQIIEREVNDILGIFSPTFRMFSSSITKYIINIIDPYIDAFMNNGQINTKAAGGFVKEEINTKIDNFMKKFEEENGRYENRRKSDL